MTIIELLRQKARLKQIAMQTMLDGNSENDEQLTKKAWYFIKNVFESISSLDTTMDKVVAVSVRNEGERWKFQIVREGIDSRAESLSNDFYMDANKLTLDYKFIKQKAEEEGLEFIQDEDRKGFNVYAVIHPEQKS